MDDKYSLAEVTQMLDKREYIHFITLKPPHILNKKHQVMKLMEYLIKRQVLFWIVECKSHDNYTHYHGVVSYPNTCSIEGMNKIKSAFQRKVNRDIGFCYPLQKVHSLPAVYNYIRGDSNQFITEWLTNINLI